MTDRSTSDMTREELEMEVQLLRAALKRHGGEVTTTDILRVERDRNNRLAIEPRVDELATYKGRLPATVRKAIWVPSHDTPVGSFKRTHSGVPPRSFQDGLPRLARSQRQCGDLASVA